jgi:hypothetical protein
MVEVVGLEGERLDLAKTHTVVTALRIWNQNPSRLGLLVGREAIEAKVAKKPLLTGGLCCPRFADLTLISAS